MQYGGKGLGGGTVVQVSSEEGKSHVMVAMEQQKVIIWLLMLSIVLGIVSTVSSIISIERLGNISNQFVTHEIMLARTEDRFQNVLTQAQLKFVSAKTIGATKVNTEDIIPH